MFEQVKEALDEALEDWEMMQQTSGDDGADWAERFERHFYIFIEQLQRWYYTLEQPPKDIDEAEKYPEIITIEEKLPAPLQLNFITELEHMIDGIELSEYD